MLDRIRRTGYTSGARGWSLGENIAWGSGRLATAAQIHRAWMSSPGHRANILQRSFREIGIGIETGAPRAALRVAVGRHVHHRLRLPPIEQGLRWSPGGGGALLASAAPWPTSSPSTPSTTRSTVSAACRPSWRRPTT